MTSLAPRSGIRGAPLANVLIVDDDYDSAEALLVSVEHAGYAARVALDAPEALTVVEDDFTPDFAVIEVSSPDVDGLTLAAILRERPRLKQCVLISVSGFVDRDLLARSLGAGFAVHLSKPVDMDVLLAEFSRATVQTHGAAL